MSYCANKPNGGNHKYSNSADAISCQIADNSNVRNITHAVSRDGTHIKDGSLRTIRRDIT